MRLFHTTEVCKEKFQPSKSGWQRVILKKPRIPFGTFEGKSHLLTDLEMTLPEVFNGQFL